MKPLPAPCGAVRGVRVRLALVAVVAALVGLRGFRLDRRLLDDDVLDLDARCVGDQALVCPAESQGEQGAGLVLGDGRLAVGRVAVDRGGDREHHGLDEEGELLLVHVVFSRTSRVGRGGSRLPDTHLLPTDRRRKIRGIQTGRRAETRQDASELTGVRHLATAVLRVGGSSPSIATTSPTS